MMEQCTFEAMNLDFDRPCSVWVLSFDTIARPRSRAVRVGVQSWCFAWMRWDMSVNVDYSRSVGSECFRRLWEGE